MPLTPWISQGMAHFCMGVMTTALSFTTIGGMVSKHGLFEPFMYENEHFTKTGSGQT
jgi:hypothetical protein